LVNGMKKVLITGANSYIGTSFEKYIKENYPGQYVINTIDMKDGSWRNQSFAGYDSVFHVAGIAHQKETKKNAHLYYEVNRDLAIETAKKAKSEGVRQFVFLSSMSIYGMEIGVITRDTVPNPKTAYGASKLQAEETIQILSEHSFRVCILRPPMVYGDGCKGNYRTLEKLAEVLPIFPDFYNQRSMISVNRLAGFVVMCIDRNLEGTFLPQDPEYVNTSKMVEQLAKNRGKSVALCKLLNPLVFLMMYGSKKCRKAFGSLIYREYDLVENETRSTDECM